MVLLRSNLRLLSYYSRILPQLSYRDSSTHSTAEGLVATEVDDDGGASFPGLQEIAIVLSSIDAL